MNAIMLILENLCYYTEVTVINDTVSLAWSNIYIKTSLRFRGVQTRLRRTISLYRTRNQGQDDEEKEYEEVTGPRTRGENPFSRGRATIREAAKRKHDDRESRKKNPFSLKINTQVDSLWGDFGPENNHLRARESKSRDLSKTGGRRRQTSPRNNTFAFDGGCGQVLVEGFRGPRKRVQLIMVET